MLGVGGGGGRFYRVSVWGLRFRASGAGMCRVWGFGPAVSVSFVPKFGPLTYSFVAFWAAGRVPASHASVKPQTVRDHTSRDVQNRREFHIWESTTPY